MPKMALKLIFSKHFSIDHRKMFLIKKYTPINFVSKSTSVYDPVMTFNVQQLLALPRA